MNCDRAVCSRTVVMFAGLTSFNSFNLLLLTKYMYLTHPGARNFGLRFMVSAYFLDKVE